jgi:hypothetical protein
MFFQPSCQSRILHRFCDSKTLDGRGFYDTIYAGENGDRCKPEVSDGMVCHARSEQDLGMLLKKVALLSNQRLISLRITPSRE